MTGQQFNQARFRISRNDGSDIVVAKGIFDGTKRTRRSYPNNLRPQPAYSLLMNSYIPAGPEAAPTTQTSQPVASPTLAPQSGSNSTGLSPGSITLIASFLSLFVLVVLAVVAYWIRRRRTTKIVDHRRSLETRAIGEIPDVRWTPQIRSINGPPRAEGSRRTLPHRRARSPPPSNDIKPLTLFPNPYPKSAPAYAPSFPQDDTPSLEKSSRGDISPAVSSSMRTRSWEDFGSYVESAGRVNGGL